MKKREKQGRIVRSIERGERIREIRKEEWQEVGRKGGKEKRQEGRK